MIEHQYFSNGIGYFKVVRVTILNCQEDEYDPLEELWVDGDYLHILTGFGRSIYLISSVTKIELYDREAITDPVFGTLDYEDSNFQTIYEVKP